MITMKLEGESENRTKGCSLLFVWTEVLSLSGKSLCWFHTGIASLNFIMKKTGFNKVPSGYFLEWTLCYFSSIPKYKVLSLFESQSLHKTSFFNFILLIKILHKTSFKSVSLSSFPESMHNLHCFILAILYLIFNLEKCIFQPHLFYMIC